MVGRTARKVKHDHRSEAQKSPPLVFLGFEGDGHKAVSRSHKHVIPLAQNFGLAGSPGIPSETAAGFAKPFFGRRLMQS
jgi:hypothetical protein